MKAISKTLILQTLDWYSHDKAEIEDYIKEIIEDVEQMPTNEVLSSWIPVKDQLPEYEEDVLCTLSDFDGGGLMVLHLTNNWGQDEWVDGQMGTGSYEVAAWMPLPEEYEGDTDEEDADEEDE